MIPPIKFPESIPTDKRSEIRYVLQRIDWNREAPNKIEILRNLIGGRSSSDVLECRIRWGNSEFLKVVKIGSASDLKLETTGFENIKKPNSFFAPIEAATPGIYEKSQVKRGEREAIVYAHIEQWFGSRRIKTFEDIARLAITNGGSDLEKAIQLLETFFNGIRPYLYNDFARTNSSLMELWNPHLGPDGTIEADHFDPANQLFMVGSPSETQLKNVRVYPDDVTPTESWKRGNIKPGDFVYLTDLKVEWHDDRLMGKSDPTKFLPRRFEIVGKDRRIRDIATSLTEGSSFDIYGKLKSIRELTYKNLILSNLQEIQIENGSIKGKGGTGEDVIVPNLFEFLPIIFEAERTYIITSLVHGDLNPRNILVTENGQPCLIDYAHTNRAEPLLSDFLRLEGCLARDVLPDDITWQEHVRLQRLLATASRLGNIVEEKTMIENFTQLLAKDRSELASAFCLFYTIRKESKQSYPQSELDQWYRDYCEQLFLFAYLALKWEEESQQQTKESNAKTIRATAAMAGVASEAISEKDVYRWWSLEDIQGDGLEIIRLLKANSNPPLFEIANLARGMDFWKEKKENREPLLSKYELLIKNEYLRDSRVNKELDAKLGDSLLSEFEELRAVFVRNQKAFRYKALDEIQMDRIKREKHKIFINLKGSLKNGEGDDSAINLIAGKDEVVLVGDAGGGKTTVVREWKSLLTELITGNKDTLNRLRLDNKKCTPRLPVILEAPRFWDNLKDWKKNDKQSTANVLPKDLIPKDDQSILHYSDLLTVGALHISIDALNELPEEKKELVKDWIITLRKMYRHTPVLVCHRRYNYPPGFLPFPMITLQKMTYDQIKEYVEHNKIAEAENLIRPLLEEPAYRNLAQIPLFLWMIVNYYQEKKEILKSRGQLFKQFSRLWLEESYHTEHGEQVQFKYGYDDKKLLLGAIGYELLQHGDAYLLEKNVESIIPKEIKLKVLNSFT